MKKYFWSASAFAFILLTLTFSCSKEKDLSEREIQERILDAYIAVNYPNAVKLESGLTIIEVQPGKTDPPKDGEGAYIHYSTYTLEGICQSTTDSVQAKHLGTYSASNYYGPTLFVLNKYYTTEGMIELLKQVGKGGHVKAIIPPWLTGKYNSKSSGKSSSGSQQSMVNIIYDIHMGDIVEEITKYQIDSIESYNRIYYPPGIDSTTYGFYIKNFTHPSGIPDKDTVEASTKVNIWYIGRLLDGYVFDTNIRDTAKKYRIYNSSSDYTALTVEIQETAKLMNETQKSGSEETSGALILGFCKALKKMTIGDHAVTMFVSGLGYGSEGTMNNGSGVPWYSPLRFDIWMTTSVDNKYPPVNFDGE